MMKKIFLPLFLLIINYQLSIIPCQAQYSNLHNFSNAGDGKNPIYGDLTPVGGFLYGMTYAGGASDSGIIFKIQPDGSNYSQVFSFSGLVGPVPTGRHPRGSLIYDGTTYLYGMTENGGASNAGVIFRIKPDGSQYANLLSFSGSDGSNPTGSLIYDGTYLYGMTLNGGDNSLGTVFKITPGGTYSKLLDFAGTSNGRNPRGSLIYDGTYLYGMTSAGGTVTTIAYPNGCGTVFKITPGGTYTKLHDFSASTNDGSLPKGSLVSDGAYLYGMTQEGGVNGMGTIFKIKPDATYSKLLDFDGTSKGRSPDGTLIYKGSFLFGMTSEGGADDQGALFKITPNGTNYANLLSFSCGTYGCTPFGSLISDNTFFYGMTYQGGSTNTTNNGTIFKYQYCTPVTSTQTVTVCSGQSLTVGVHTYTASGSYTDTLATVVNGCDSVVNTTLTVNSTIPGTLSITGVTTICNGSTTTLTGSGAVSYVWASGGGTTSAITVSPTSSTSYSLTGIDGGGCSIAASATVTVNPLPNMSITGLTTICNGNATTLAAAGATSYVWNSGQSTAAITVSPTSSTSYTVTGTDANSCSKAATKMVTVNYPAVYNQTLTVCAGQSVKVGIHTYTITGTYTDILTSSAVNGCDSTVHTNLTVSGNTPPSVSITGLTTICNGSATTLTGTGAISYVWASGVSTTAITVSPTGSTSYTVTGTDGNSCTNTATAMVTVNSLPAVTVNTSASTVCAGAPVTLSGAGATSYVWTSGGSTSAITVSPTSSTTYTVTGTDAHSCSNTATKMITVNPLPSVSIIGVTTICNGNATTLTGTGAISYVWASGGVSTTAITVSPTTSTGYTVTGTGANNCSKVATAMVTVNSLPAVSITGLTTICNGSATTLTGTGATSYLWASGGSTSAITVSPTGNTSYTVTGTDANNCSKVATAMVTVNALPTVSITGLTTICKGNVTTLTGAGAVSYMWSSGQSTTAITVSPTGNTSYTVTGTNANNCSSNAIKTVTVNPLPNVTTSLTGVVIMANQTGATYQWVDCNNGNLPISGATNQSYSVTATGSYAVILTLVGCPDTSGCVNVTVVGINEIVNTNLFAVYPNPSTGIIAVTTLEKECELNICNFLGEKVFIQKIQGDRTEINLSNQPAGIYFLQVKTEKGTATEKLIIEK